MVRETIVQIWESEGLRPTGHTIIVRDDRDATCFIETKGELMTVSNVAPGTVAITDGAPQATQSLQTGLQ